MGADEPQGGNPLADVQKALGEQIDGFSSVLDTGLDAASVLVKSTTAVAKDEAEKAAGVVQVRVPYRMLQVICCKTQRPC